MAKAGTTIEHELSIYKYLSIDQLASWLRGRLLVKFFKTISIALLLIISAHAHRHIYTQRTHYIPVQKRSKLKIFKIISAAVLCHVMLAYLLYFLLLSLYTSASLYSIFWFCRARVLSIEKYFSLFILPSLHLLSFSLSLSRSSTFSYKWRLKYCTYVYFVSILYEW